MNGIDAGGAILLLVDFLFGVLAGVVGSVARASTHEDRRTSLTGAAPDPGSAGARALHGVYVRGTGWETDVLRGERPADGVVPDTPNEGRRGDRL
jgi:hypothetical protein